MTSQPRQPRVLGKATIRVLWEPRDLWIGVYRDTAKQRIYVCPLPCLAFVIERPSA